jgi:hypothetical protein
VQALTNVNDTLYAEGERLNAWKVSDPAAARVITAAPFDTVSCFDEGPVGPYFASEVFDRAGATHFELAELNSGAVKEFPVPSDTDTCAALTFFPGAMTVVRTPTAYRPFLVVHMFGGFEFQRLPNPLRQSAGLQTVLRNARLSHDGRRLIASSDNSGLAVFDLAAERLIGAIAFEEVRHVALWADSKVALVEGGGKIFLVDLDPVSRRWKA